jgi:peptide/nickel transport system permease protein
MSGLIGVCLLVLIGVCGPLLANRQPIVCHYDGAWHFPALVDVIHELPFTTRIVSKSRPFRYPQFDAKRDLPADTFALWPPIRYGPRETSASILEGPTGSHLLGTDDVGRDVAARLIRATSASMGAGLGAVLLAAFIGIPLGGLAGYKGGKTDILVSRLIELFTCFPVFFLILAVMAWIGPGTGIVGLAIVIGLVRWTAVARYTRGEFLHLKAEDYVLAARAQGAGLARILFVHLLPNAMGPVLVALAFGVANVILIEAGLSWLGFGVQLPDPSWGNMLRTGYAHLEAGPHLIFASCAAIFFAVLCCNLVADGLRRAANPEEGCR